MNKIFTGVFVNVIATILIVLGISFLESNYYCSKIGKLINMDSVLEISIVDFGYICKFNIDDKASITMEQAFQLLKEKK